MQALGGAGGAEDAVVEAKQVLDALDQVGLVIDDEQAVFVFPRHAAFLLSGRLFLRQGQAILHYFEGFVQPFVKSGGLELQTQGFLD